jgi:hypothetical protein
MKNAGCNYKDFIHIPKRKYFIKYKRDASGKKTGKGKSKVMVSVKIFK